MKSYASNDGLCKQIRKLFCFLEMKEQAITEFQNYHFQNEAKCKTFLVKMSFIRTRIKHVFISMALHLASL